MLLKSYTVKTMMPECNPMSESINAIADLDEDVSEVLPYLATTIKLCTYDDNAKTLSFKQEGRRVNIYPQRITLTGLKEREDAGPVLDVLKELINRTYENRQNIKPRYQKGGELKYLEVFKLLPRTNCQDCGKPTCLAFATKLVQQEASIRQCTSLFTDQFEDNRKKLLHLFESADHEVPDTYP